MLQSILKRLSNHENFSYSRENRFRSHLLTTDDVNLEKKFKIECCDQFSIFVFGRRIDQSITLQVTKVPREEEPSAEMLRGEGEGVSG